MLDLACNRIELPPTGNEPGEEAKEGGGAAEGNAEAAAFVARLLPASLRIVDLRGNPGLENGNAVLSKNHTSSECVGWRRRTKVIRVHS